MNDKLLLKEINVKSELNTMIFQQDDQIEYYKKMLELLKESINSIKIFIDDEQ